MPKWWKSKQQEIKQMDDDPFRLLNAVQKHLTDDDIEDVNIFIQAGEWELGLEHICTQLYEYDVRVNDDVLIEMDRLGNMMGLDKNYWNDLRKETSKVVLDNENTCIHCGYDRRGTPNRCCPECGDRSQDFRKNVRYQIFSSRHSWILILLPILILLIYSLVQWLCR